MNIQSLKLNLPFCTSDNAQQTRLSLVTRSLAVAFGTIALLAGVFLLCTAQQLSPWMSTCQWMLLAAGSASLLAGTILKCVKQEAPQDIQETLLETEPEKIGVENPLDARETLTDYSLEAVIDRILTAKCEGKQTAVFVGRMNNQTVPAEEGWEWFSLDREMAPEKNSHHLQLDLNHTHILGKLYGLFDKVVVDIAVIKTFVGSPWDNLQPLLINQPTSQLIVETDRDINATVTGNDRVVNARKGEMMIPISEHLAYERAQEEAFNTWKTRVGEAHVRSEYKKFLSQFTAEEIAENRRMNNGTDRGLELRFMRFILQREKLNPPKDETSRRELLKAISEYLQTLFHHVELKKTPYPYRGEENLEEYWVLTHPK